MCYCGARDCIRCYGKENVASFLDDEARDEAEERGENHDENVEDAKDSTAENAFFDRQRWGP